LAFYDMRRVMIVIVAAHAVVLCVAIVQAIRLVWDDRNDAGQAQDDYSQRRG
jgi:hypothetical protein